MNICRICGSNEISEFSIKNRNYIHCKICGSVCTDSNSFENKEKQKLRYEKHNNSLRDEGYRNFLESFIKPILQELTYLEINKILDYGSGPEPELCRLLMQYALEGTILEESCDIRGWDPFFAPDTDFFKEGADLVTCLEVAEHFENPREDMKKMADCCRPDGYVAVGTMLLPGISEFKNWWYRSDFTHVAFYTLDGLRFCAEKAGLEFIKAVNERVFLFKRKV